MFGTDGLWDLEEVVWDLEGSLFPTRYWNRLRQFTRMLIWFAVTGLPGVQPESSMHTLYDSPRISSAYFMVPLTSLLASALARLGTNMCQTPVPFLAPVSPDPDIPAFTCLRSIV